MCGCSGCLSNRGQEPWSAGTLGNQYQIKMKISLQLQNVYFFLYYIYIYIYIYIYKGMFKLGFSVDQLITELVSL